MHQKLNIRVEELTFLLGSNRHTPDKAAAGRLARHCRFRCYARKLCGLFGVISCIHRVPF